MLNFPHTTLVGFPLENFASIQCGLLRSLSLSLSLSLAVCMCVCLFVCVCVCGVCGGRWGGPTILCV